MNQQVPMNYNYDEDEIDLKELLAIIVKEKKTVFITFLVISILSLGAALYVRNKAKVAATILNVKTENDKKVDLLPNSIVERLYFENNIKEKEELSLDEFKDEFKITGIIPKSIKLKQEALEKKGETLKYTPENYVVELRVGTPEESKKILEDYYKDLNEELEYRNASRYRYQELETKNLSNAEYDYQDYLDIIKEKKAILKDTIAEKSKTNLDYLSYGFKYRDLQAKIKNLEEIEINPLQNYLDSTGIVKDYEDFKNSYASRIEKLKNSLEEKNRKKSDYEKMLNEFKVEDKNKVVPKGVKIVTQNNEREKYYISLMKEYIGIQDEIVGLQMQISKLEAINGKLKEATPDEKKYIDTKLQNIFKEYNEIVKEANDLKIKENEIEYGAMAKKLNPVVIISDSKAKLILAVGVVLGLFVGVMMAFVKNFFKDFKKYMGVLVVFLLVGVNTYTKESVNFSFTHKGMKENENPDKTPFELKKQVLEFFKEKNIKVNSDDIVVKPMIKAGLVKPTFQKVKGKIENEEINASFVPTEYVVIVPDKNMAESLKKEFPRFYVDYYINNEQLNVISKGGSYRDRIKGLKNNLDIIQNDIDNRKKLGLSKEKESEYKVAELEIWRVNNTTYKNLENFMSSNKIVSNIELEKTILAGERENILRELNSLDGKAKFYEELLKKYNVSNSEARVLENGDISLAGSGEREKQYIEISNEYALTLDKINSLKRELMENENLEKGMREPTKEEKDKIEKSILTLEEEIKNINERIKNIELRDSKREYEGSVKAF